MIALILALLIPTSSEPAQNLVPEGPMKIAQRFIAGSAMTTNDLSPVGTDESCWPIQSFLRDYFTVLQHTYPSDNSLGYYQQPLRGASAPSSQPARRPAGAVPFQPGVQIDWQNRAVLVGSRVVLRHGPLEFLACRPGKEHESVLRLEASAAHIYLALGLIGLTPGHPPSWDEPRGEYGPPTGDLVEIACEWDFNGRHHSVTASTFLREIEYARTPIPRPWVFAGSLRLRDGSLAADRSGVGIALVDFSDSLLSLSRGFPSRYGELWAKANTPAIPLIGTPVRLILRPARLRAYRVNLDFRGQVFVDGHYVRPADLADLLKLARQLDPDYVQVINAHATLHGDVVRLQQMLVKLGLPSEAVRIKVVERDDPP